MSYGSGENERSTTENKFRGVRCRKWGKWVSEIRVPGTKERLWLGTYSTPEAAAMAHDVAFYCLKRPSSMEKLNFPAMLPSYCVQHRDMSPRSVQKVASDAGMALDAQRISGKPLMTTTEEAYGMEKSDTDHRHHTDDGFWWEGGVGDDDGTSESRDDHRGEGLSISIEDYTNLGVEDCPLFW